MNLQPLSYLLSAAVYSGLGIAVLVLTFVILDRITPYALWKEIVEKQNHALATLLGLMSLAIGVIIAAAIH